MYSSDWRRIVDRMNKINRITALFSCIETLRSCLKSPGIGEDERWTPACVGVTTRLTVIPAQAGIQASATWSHFQNF
jgi:hypothetical protein